MGAVGGRGVIREAYIVSMPRSVDLIRRMALLSRRHSFLKGPLAGASALKASLQGGGIRFIPDNAILGALLRDMGRTGTMALGRYCSELLADKPLRDTFEAESKKRKITKYKSWQDRVDRLTGNIALYYGIIRELRPSVIVETGTATGSMTSFLLAALNRNRHGKLISIDLPAHSGQLTMDITVAPEDVGYWIPVQYRERWDYRPGDAKVLLPGILSENRVDVFIHDSLHTRSHMAFEYAVARALLPPNALIMSDDILWNDAFQSFTALHRLNAYSPIGNPNIAAVVNAFDEEELRNSTSTSAATGSRKA